MHILQVVHGYPPRYNAGTEVYTQTLCRALAARHQVEVFTRFEDPFLPPYQVRMEHTVDLGRSIPIHLLNLPHFRDRYRHEAVDRAFQRVLKAFRPDVVHVQHLNHLSTSVVQVAAAAGVPVVFTLHDFWLMCPRGQFIQFFSADGKGVLPLCDGQENSKCARHCYSRYFSGAPDGEATDIAAQADWVARRMEHVREICQTVDQFIAPSRHLRSRFVSEFGIPSERVTLLDYGFDLARLRGRTRLRRDREEFVFGYIGTHIPAKGVHHLLEAFASLKQPARLRLWGRPNSETTPALKSICASLPIEVQQRITWEGEYKNERIVPEVFDHVDAIVVPSIWLENSPLVIHEAQQARVPVITADVGGMAEFVQHEVNGLLFRHRDSTALAEQMARFVGYPEWAAQLGARGYLYSTSGDVPSIQDHLAVIEQTYGRCLKGSSSPAMEVGV